MERSTACRAQALRCARCTDLVTGRLKEPNRFAPPRTHASHPSAVNVFKCLRGAADCHGPLSPPCRKRHGQRRRKLQMTVNRGTDCNDNRPCLACVTRRRAPQAARCTICPSRQPRRRGGIRTEPTRPGPEAYLPGTKPIAKQQDATHRSRRVGPLWRGQGARHDGACPQCQAPVRLAPVRCHQDRRANLSPCLP